MKPHLRVSTSACRVLAPSSLKSFASTCAFSVRVCVCVCACVCVCVCVCVHKQCHARKGSVYTHMHRVHTHAPPPSLSLISLQARKANQTHLATAHLLARRGTEPALAVPSIPWRPLRPDGPIGSAVPLAPRFTHISRNSGRPGIPVLFVYGLIHC